MGSFDVTTNKISKWKSTGIFNRSSNSKYRASSNMDAVGDPSGNLPNLKNDGRINVYLSGNQQNFQQNVAGVPNNDNVINIYCVYKLDPITSTRDTSFTIQDALFGAMQITKNATDNSKNNYKGYGISCESEKTGLYENICDFVVDYEQILGVKPIDDMHRYLMTKHNISL